MKRFSAVLRTLGVAAFAIAAAFGQTSAYDLKKMISDHERPYLYAIQRGAGASQDSLLFIDVSSETVVKTIPIGFNVTDMTVHYGEGRLYVTNWTHTETRVVDLAAQTELPPRDLGTDVYRINAGRPGRIYCEEGDGWIDASIIDTGTGAVVGSLPGLVCHGDGEIDPTASYYYHSDDNISNARIHKYDIRTDNPVLVAESNQHPYHSGILVLSDDGARVFWKGYVYDANLEEFGTLGAEIYETTLHGELAFGSSAVYDATTGASVYTLPFSTTVMAVSGDQEKLFLFNAVTGGIVMIAMDEIADVAGPELNPDPENGATVVLPLTSLDWDDSPEGGSYRVYCGADSLAVDGAGTGSPEYLGKVTESGIGLSVELELGTKYFWRVDVVGFSMTMKGVVWSFDAAPLAVSPNAVARKMVTGGPLMEEKLVITAGGSPESWVVSEDVPWLSVDKTAGATPDTIVVTMDPSGLPEGTLTGALHFGSAGSEFDVPVELELFTMALSKMVADWTRPYIYALHPGDGNFGGAFLLFIHTESEEVERVIPVGTNPTDMAIQYAEGRLYVTNWKHAVTRVVDLGTQTEIAPLNLGTDVYKINAGRPGRIYYEGEDQWVDAKIVNTGTGLVVGSLPGNVREGDGEINLAGSFYYHCDNSTSAACVHKYDIRTDRPTEAAASVQHPSGSRNLVLSGDGKRLFWRGYMYGPNLTELRSLGAEIYATTFYGDLAFGSINVFDTMFSTSIFRLPFSTTVMAVSGDQQKLFLFNPATGGIVVIPIREILSVPVFVARFAAVSSDAGVALSWETIADENVKGFNIYRDDGSGDGPVPAKAGDLIPPHERRYVDGGVRGGHGYEYTLGVVFDDGTETMSHTVSVKTIAFKLALLQNHPNPFNPTTTIPFTLPQRTRLKLSIYDVTGRLIRTLADEVIDEGHQDRTWDGKDSKDNTVSSGVYFYRLSAGERTLVRKLVVLR